MRQRRVRVAEGCMTFSTVDGYTVTARIAHDETPDAPDERQDGFWPSLYPDDAGFIGAGNGWRDRFAASFCQSRLMALP